MSPLELLAKLEKPLTLELRSGCADRAIVGGVERYVSSWVRRAEELGLAGAVMEVLGEIERLVRGYGLQTEEERSANLRRALELIKGFRARIGPKQGTLFEIKPEKKGAAPERVPISYPPTSDDPSLLERLLAPISSVKGIGPKRSSMLMAGLGIATVMDMLEYFPRDYIDRSRIRQIYQAGRRGEIETIQGKVVEISETTSRRGNRKIVKVKIYDGTGVASLVAFDKLGELLKRMLSPGEELVVSGRFKRSFGEVEATDFEFEILSKEDAELIHTGRIVPKYRLTSQISQRNMRYMMKLVLDQYSHLIPEHLPLELRRRLRLMDRRSAILNIHFPESEAHLKEARRRLAFDELFLIQLGLALKRRHIESERGIAFEVDGPLFKAFMESLPFELTRAQRRVIEEIRRDMSRPRPMNRLIQGDVGSGKTVVAAAAMVIAADNGYQSAMMAPTEILAYQHYLTLSQLLEPLGLRVVMLRGEMRASDRREALEAIRSGEAKAVVGTHALIQEGVEFHKLGLVITDEQHRFGVLQRAALREKGISPDVLVMTATPIPRTLALTVYGDLDLSIIDELPPGRRKVKTYWVPEEKRPRMYEFIREEVKKGRQAYVVYPLVEESEKLEDVKAATEMARHLQEEVFPDLRVGLLHGRMHPAEKEEVMRRFKGGEIDILVSTTVVEVGVDVPNASIMVIENAERFGLAQLHQLRGRVGRSTHQSYCFLMADPKSEDARRRIEAMVRTNDGFRIAEVDLAIRGPGELMGTRQSGMPDLKVADLLRDVELLKLARAEARKLVEKDPLLLEREHRLLREMVRRMWRESLEMLSIG
ncbi:DNA helicase RecG [Candidatus Poribacteria bacterium]|nr:MAG: DNA helicase RecG [Candidatus Poribacteria bacterium]